jgi:hypothetical protein
LEFRRITQFEDEQLAVRLEDDLPLASLAHNPPRGWPRNSKARIEDGKLAEHWDVLQDEATKAQSVSGLPMFGDGFPA